MRPSEARPRCDKDGYVRSTAIDVLSEIWRDGTTQELLTERAVLDETESVRRASLEILSKKWQDNTTQELLMKLAQTDGFAASLLGRQHSEFGKIIFAKHLDAVERYINPAKPIHRERIKRAAEWANVPPDQIDEAVRTLSEHVGWNITKGLSGAIDK